MKYFLIFGLRDWFSILVSYFKFKLGFNNDFITKFDQIAFTFTKIRNQYHVSNDLLSQNIKIIIGNSLIYLRKGSSDILVFEQIFLNQEYRLLIDLVHQRGLPVNFILDAGANIGLSALYFYQNLGQAKIICLEPSEYNFNQLKKNTIGIPDRIILNKAIWHENTRVSMVRDFRDKRDWSIQVKEGLGEIESATILSLMDEFGINTLDILKIDVEGAEKYLFQNEDEALSFLRRTRLIAIEIHPEMIDPTVITEILVRADFEIFYSGELVIGHNKAQF